MQIRKNARYFFYKIICIISSSITPGTPKNPTITAFNGLITIDNPNKPPIKLKTNNSAPPIIPFINSLINILIGITKSNPTIYNKTNPNRNANNVVIDNDINFPPFTPILLI